jgi:hypothetical protein
MHAKCKSDMQEISFSLILSLSRCALPPSQPPCDASARRGTDEGTMDLNDDNAGCFKFGAASDGMRACSRRAGSPRLRLCCGTLRSE